MKQSRLPSHPSVGLQRAVNRSRADIEHSRLEILNQPEHVPRALDDGFGAFSLVGGMGECCRVGCGVDNIILWPARQSEIRDMAPDKINTGNIRFRKTTQESRRIARKHRQSQAEIQLRVRVAKSRQEPLAKKAGSTGEKQAFAAQFLKVPGRMATDMGQVVYREREEIVLRFARHRPNTPW